MASNYKAMYPISLDNDGKTDQQRNVVNVNQERLNDNFRTISAALSDLYASGNHTLNFLSARIKEGDTVLMNTINGVEERVNEHTAEILALPGAIMMMVGESMNNPSATGDLVQQVMQSLITQTANDITVAFNRADISSWVRIVAADAGEGTNAGVIIGDTKNPYSLKAESGAIFFFRGEEKYGKFSNALAGFDADGNFIAGNIHNVSTLLDGKFDIDVVTAKSLVNGTSRDVDFLHITGRS